MKSILLEKSLSLAVITMKWTSEIHFGDSVFIKNQIQRSCTSIGANIREASGSKSQKDFINKLKTAYQELEETEYWLRIISDFLNTKAPDEIHQLCLECRKMMSSSISTAIKNLKNKQH
jgi:four helix bundle protein